MTSKEALEKLSYIPIYEEDEHNVITDIDSCCVYKGDLCEVYGSEVDTIKKDLERLETYDKTKKIYGIDLITLFKATQQGIWMKHNNDFYFFDNLIVDFKHKCLVQIVSNDEVETFPFDSYGEDWGLTKEELENDR